MSGRAIGDARGEYDKSGEGDAVLKMLRKPAGMSEFCESPANIQPFLRHLNSVGWTKRVLIVALVQLLCGIAFAQNDQDDQVVPIQSVQGDSTDSQTNKGAEGGNANGIEEAATNEVGRVPDVDVEVEVPGRYEDDGLARYTFWLVIFNGLLFSSTAALFIATWRAASAASKAAKIADITLRVTQRANLGLSNWKIDGLPDGMSPKQLQFVISNQGPTIATIRGRYISQSVTASLPEIPVQPKDEKIHRCSLPISPQFRLRQTVEFVPISRDFLEKIQSGRSRYWVWGFVEYLDVFDAVHRTGFCVVYEVNTKEFRVGGPDGYSYAT